MSSTPALRLTPVQWLVCTIAAIGFAFDIYELLMLPLIIKPAMAALSAPLIDEAIKAGMERPAAMALWLPGGANYVKWARVLFFVPALAGGIFGLWGGWLTDRLGRRRVLTFSILLYAFGACAAGFSTSLRAGREALRPFLEPGEESVDGGLKSDIDLVSTGQGTKTIEVNIRHRIQAASNGMRS
jgi:MFS family permease